VLKNRQNPLVLKLTINPQTGGDVKPTLTDTGLQSVFGFEVANLQVQAVR
jgi:hypothetical protein